jgi:hypothetical protein
MWLCIKQGITDRILIHKKGWNKAIIVLRSDIIILSKMYVITHIILMWSEFNPTPSMQFGFWCDACGVVVVVESLILNSKKKLIIPNI